MPTGTLAVTEAPDVAGFSVSVTPHISDVQSYSWIIRDVFFDALVGDSFFTGYFARKTKMVPVQFDQLPFLGVYIVDETMVPDGDANAGNIRFNHTLRIGFSVFVAMNDQNAAEQQIDAAYWRINNRIYRDPKIMALWPPGNTNPDGVGIESIMRGMRRLRFGSARINNQTPLAELQYDVSVFYRSTWDPVITDDLLEIDVTTGVKSDDTPEAMAQRRQEHAQYLFEAGSPSQLKRPSRYAEYRNALIEFNKANSKGQPNG